MQRGAWLVVVVLALVVASISAQINNNAVQVSGLGVIQGVPSPTTDGVIRFLGIPYASPPVGSLRFRPPQPLTSLPSNPFNASRFGYICPQLSSLPGNPFENLNGLPQNFDQSEDCLTLNIYVPNTPGTKSVDVYIYGGSNFYGSSQNPILRADQLALHGDIIVVTFNYRLGALGFLAIPEYYQQDGTTGNNGLLDQRVVLEWVSRNIGAFGGNGSSITIHGQSSAPLFQLVSSLPPLDFIAGAIVQSASPFWTIQTLGYGFNITKALLSEFNCSGLSSAEQLECLLDTPAESYVNSPIYIGKAAATIDGYFFKSYPYPEQTRNISIPILFGSNGAEGSDFIYPEVPDPIPGDLYVSLLPSLIAPLYDRFAPLVNLTFLLDYYPIPPANATDIRSYNAKILADGIMNCPSNIFGETFGTFAYLFNLIPNTPEYLGSQHGAELPYIFGTLDYVSHNTTTPEQDEIALILQTYWSNFIKYQDPGTVNGVRWPKLEACYNYQRLYFVNNTVETITDYLKVHPDSNGPASPICTFWNNFYQQVANISNSEPFPTFASATSTISLSSTSTASLSSTSTTSLSATSTPSLTSTGTPSTTVSVSGTSTVSLSSTSTASLSSTTTASLSGTSAASLSSTSTASLSSTSTTSLSATSVPSLTPTASVSYSYSPSASFSVSASLSPARPSTCPVVTPSPSPVSPICASPSPLPGKCESEPNGKVVINFFFGDVLRQTKRGY